MIAPQLDPDRRAHDDFLATEPAALRRLSRARPGDSGGTTRDIAKTT
jgi:hypothetical protein